MNRLKFLVFALILITLSCSSDDDNPQTEDIQQLVENFVTPELIQSLTDLGFTFRDGLEHPDISGDFLYTPVEMVSTNIVGDEDLVGQIFNDISFDISNLNPQARTFNVVVTEGFNTTAAPLNTFYSGEGNAFSAYIKIPLMADEDTTLIVLYAISGIITDEGVSNAELAIIMLDDNGDPTDSFIENGEGRRFIDGDGLAEKSQ